MALSKKQFDFTIRGRVLAVNTAGTLSLANLQVVVDSVALEGIEYDLTTPVLNGDVSYNTLVKNYTTATTAPLADVMDDVLSMIGTLKAIV